MKDYSDVQKVKESSMKAQEKITRRNFAKKAIGLGFLSSLTLMHIPQTALRITPHNSFGFTLFKLCLLISSGFISTPPLQTLKIKY